MYYVIRMAEYSDDPDRVIPVGYVYYVSVHENISGDTVYSTPCEEDAIETAAAYNNGYASPDFEW